MQLFWSNSFVRWRQRRWQWRRRIRSSSICALCALYENTIIYLYVCVHVMWRNQFFPLSVFFSSLALYNVEWMTKKLYDQFSLWKFANFYCSSNLNDLKLLSMKNITEAVASLMISIVKYYILSLKYVERTKNHTFRCHVIECIFCIYILKFISNFSTTVTLFFSSAKVNPDSFFFYIHKNCPIWKYHSLFQILYS